MDRMTGTIVGAVGSAIFTAAIFGLFFLFQRFHPRFVDNDGTPEFVLTQNAGVTFMCILLFPFTGTGFIMFLWVAVLLIRGWWPDEAKGVLFPAFVVVMCGGMFVMTLMFAIGIFRGFFARLCLSKTGIRCWYFRRSHAREYFWEQIKAITYKKGSLKIKFIDNKRFELDPYWNGFPMLYFFLELFVPNEKWAEVKKMMEATYGKKRKFLTAKREFEERIKALIVANESKQPESPMAPIE